MLGAIFDLDGTLIDSMGVWSKADSDYLSMHGCIASPTLPQEISALNYREAVAYIGAKYKINKSLDVMCSEILDLVRHEYAEKISIKKGAQEYLRLLHNSGVKICLVTSCLEELAQSVLERYGIYELFEYRFYAGARGYKKNDPAIFSDAAKLMELSPADCVVFEDMAFAARSALEAGMRVIGVDNHAPQFTTLPLENYCEKIIDDYIDLANEYRNSNS